MVRQQKEKHSLGVSRQALVGTHACRAQKRAQNRLKRTRSCQVSIKQSWHHYNCMWASGLDTRKFVRWQGKGKGARGGDELGGTMSWR